MPDDPAPQLGPLRGSTEMLDRVLERSCDAISLHRAMKGLTLFSESASVPVTVAKAGDHPLVQAVLVWRDRYLASRKNLEHTEKAIEKLDDVVIKDDDAAERFARSVAEATRNIAAYEKQVSATLENITDTIDRALRTLSATEKHDVHIIVDEVKRLRSMVELERRKMQVGIRAPVDQKLRVSALALMQARERLGNGMPAGVEDGVDADGGVAE